MPGTRRRRTSPPCERATNSFSRCERRGVGVPAAIPLPQGEFPVTHLAAYTASRRRGPASRHPRASFHGFAVGPVWHDQHRASPFHRSDSAYRERCFAEPGRSRAQGSCFMLNSRSGTAVGSLGDNSLQAHDRRHGKIPGPCSGEVVVVANDVSVPAPGDNFDSTFARPEVIRSSLLPCLVLGAAWRTARPAPPAWRPRPARNMAQSCDGSSRVGRRHRPAAESAAAVSIRSHQISAGFLLFAR